MIEFGSETYYFDWDIFQYSLIVVGLCVSVVSASPFKIHFRILRKFRRSFLAMGLISFLVGFGITISRIENDPYEIFVTYEEKLVQWAVCEETTDCMVVDKCSLVQAVNKKFEKEYAEELLKSSIVQIRGCLKGEPDSRRAQYSAECFEKRCKYIIVKPSTMKEVEDRLNGIFDSE